MPALSMLNDNAYTMLTFFSNCWANDLKAGTHSTNMPPASAQVSVMLNTMGMTYRGHCYLQSTTGTATNTFSILPIENNSKWQPYTMTQSYHTRRAQRVQPTTCIRQQLSPCNTCHRWCSTRQDGHNSSDSNPSTATRPTDSPGPDGCAWATSTPTPHNGVQHI